MVFSRYPSLIFWILFYSTFIDQCIQESKHSKEPVYWSEIFPASFGIVIKGSGTWPCPALVIMRRSPAVPKGNPSHGKRRSEAHSGNTLILPQRSVSTLKVLLELGPFFLHSCCTCLNVFFQVRPSLISIGWRPRLWLYSHHLISEDTGTGQSARNLDGPKLCSQTINWLHIVSNI